MRGLKLWLLSILVLNSAVADYATRVRAVFIIDTYSGRGRDNLTPGCESTLGVFQMMLERAFENDRDRYTIDVVDGEQSSPKGVENFFRKLVVTITENLLVYYCGHGAVKEKTDDHYFLFGYGGSLARSTLRYWLYKKQPRAIILLSDACSTYQNVDLNPRAPEPIFDAVPELLLGPKGVIDLTAASPGQAAWFTQGGGIFSSALTETLMLGRQGIGLDREGKVTWVQVQEKVKKLTAEAIKRDKILVKAGGIVTSPKQHPRSYFMYQPVEYFKYVDVKNTLGEKVFLKVHYVGYDEAKDWAWIPADPAQDATGFSYPLEAGASTRLVTGKDAATGEFPPVYAYTVRWEVYNAAGAKIRDALELAGNKDGYVAQSGGRYDSYVIEIK